MAVPCKIAWTSNGHKIKTSTVKRAMGAAYEFNAVDICRRGPTTIRAAGRSFYGVPVGKRRPKYRW